MSIKESKSNDNACNINIVCKTFLDKISIVWQDTTIT